MSNIKVNEEYVVTACTERFTCLCSSDESSVAFLILPIHVQIWTLREGNDHVHITMVTRHHQTRLKIKIKKLELSLPSEFDWFLVTIVTILVDEVWCFPNGKDLWLYPSNEQILASKLLNSDWKEQKIIILKGYFSALNSEVGLSELTSM